jgi:hypothetical protein
VPKTPTYASWPERFASYAELLKDRPDYRQRSSNRESARSRSPKGK